MKQVHKSVVIGFYYCGGHAAIKGLGEREGGESLIH